MKSDFLHHYTTAHLEEGDMESVVSCSAPAEEVKSVFLPVGWKSYRSPEGRKYYVNTSTNETTWERPCDSTTTLRSTSHRNSVYGHHGLGATGKVLDHPDVFKTKTSMNNQVQSIYIYNSDKSQYSQ
ncbi:NEDD4-like E3 ubiquitin-protein ligase WWP2 [Triplophysa dalaica]|uniref:NEDD4-like E3 ubiquitin-protein ligase WWP2 n=1 Tax=Triplophysa dalaica TaxID=1582913 RepID=UPI0024DF5A0A|nr:NEDD4-like E3 ubiquitin-protein ligase WWP2 [Triplophysa dalaica]